MEDNKLKGIKEVTDFTTDNPIYVKTKNQLNEVGCGMCLAKWTQVTMHLHLGHTHSCHHPSTHKIPLDELKVNEKQNYWRDVAALKKELREHMKEFRDMESKTSMLDSMLEM